MDEDYEVYDSVPANSLEEGDQIVFRGEYITLTGAEDFIDHIEIRWNDDGIHRDAPIDPYQVVELWVEV